MHGDMETISLFQQRNEGGFASSLRQVHAWCSCTHGHSTHKENSY